MKKNNKTKKIKNIFIFIVSVITIIIFFQIVAQRCLQYNVSSLGWCGGFRSEFHLRDSFQNADLVCKVNVIKNTNEGRCFRAFFRRPAEVLVKEVYKGAAENEILINPPFGCNWLREGKEVIVFLKKQGKNYQFAGGHNVLKYYKDEDITKLKEYIQNGLPSDVNELPTHKEIYGGAEYIYEPYYLEVGDEVKDGERTREKGAVGLH